MTPLRKYQLEDVETIEAKGIRCLNCNEMGTGKTLEALAIIVRNKIRLAVVVCPAFLKYQWESQAAEHCNLRVDVLETTRPPRKRLLRHQRIIVINYDILDYWVDYLRALKPELVVVDEVQRIKNMRTIRTRAVQDLCRGVPYFLPMSGTPIESRPSEFFPVLNLLWPKRFPALIPFGIEYCQGVLERGKWVFKGASKSDELHARLKRYGMVRRLKSEVLKELPPKNQTVVPVLPEDTREYNALEHDFTTWLKRTWKRNKSDNAVRMDYFAYYGDLKREAAKAKVPRVVEWIESFLEQTDEKLVVYGIHRSILKGLHERYHKTSVLINGSITGRKRHLAIEHFRLQKSCRLSFNNIDAAGMGLNLQFASHLAVIEFPWTPGQLDQAISRIHRMGQTKSTSIYLFVAVGTIEEKICRLLEKKQRVLGGVLDGDEEAGRLSIMDDLTESLIRERSNRDARVNTASA